MLEFHLNSFKMRCLVATAEAAGFDQDNEESSEEGGSSDDSDDSGEEHEESAEDTGSSDDEGGAHMQPVHAVQNIIRSSACRGMQVHLMYRYNPGKIDEYCAWCDGEIIRYALQSLKSCVDLHDDARKVMCAQLLTGTVGQRLHKAANAGSR